MAQTSILKIPVDESVTLRPTKILYLVPSNCLATTIEILDITAHVIEHYNIHFSAELKAKAKGVAKSASRPAPTYTLKNGRWYSSSRLTVTDKDGFQVAEWHSPIRAYGVTRIKFPENSPHCSHALEVKPLSVMRRAQAFVKDSARYSWEAEKRSRSGHMSLYKAFGAAKKIQVARYESDSGAFRVGGILVLEAREVDELVVLMTCMAVLNQRDSFCAPGVDLTRLKWATFASG